MEKGVMAMQKLKLLIVDDHKSARQALVQKLSGEEDLEIKDVPASAPEALSEAMAKSPEIVLLDVKTRIGDGIGLCKKLVNYYPQSKILVFTSCISQNEQNRLNETGAEDILFKDLDIQELLTAIRALH